MNVKMRKLPSNWVRRTVLAALLWTPFSHAEPKEIPDWPPIVFEKEIGESTVTLAYARPAVNGQEIWGAVVPLAQNWNLGNDTATTISFEEDVDVNGIRLGTGVYRLYVYPVSDDDWQFVFEDDATGEEMLRLATRPYQAHHRERLKVGLESIKKRRGKDVADLFIHWEERKAALHLRMTGQRAGKGLKPEVAENAREAWDVVRHSVNGMVAEDFEAHVRDFTDDFETTFGDGGNTDAHLQLLDNIRRGGMTEGMALNLEDLEIEMDDDEATVKGIVIYSNLGTINLIYSLELREDEWKVSYLSTK